MLSRKRPTSDQEQLQAALALVRRMKPEIKRYQQITTQTNYLVGSITNINTMAQGDTVSTRTGDRIQQTKLTLRLICSTFTDSTIVWRVIVFTDKRQVSGSSPSVTTVLQSDSAISAYNIDTADRWIIHRDLMFTQNARFLNGDMSSAFKEDIHIGQQAGYAGGTLNMNGLYVLITCDVPSAGSMSGKPLASDAATRFSTDLRFTDV